MGTRFGRLFFGFVFMIAACDCAADDPEEPQMCAEGTCVSKDAGTDAAADVGVDTNPPPMDTSIDSAPACESAIFCGSPPVCCSAGQECLNDMCVDSCASGVRCGANSEVCCGGGQVCISNSCETPTTMCTDSFDCESNEFCEPTVGRCLPQFETLTCQVTPTLGDFETTLEWSATSSTVVPECFNPISTPVVLDLDGDRIPEVIANTGCTGWSSGVLRAFSGVDGTELWAASERVYGRLTPAGGDIDGDGEPEIVIISERADGQLRQAMAFDKTGTLIWKSTDELGDPLQIADVNGAPALADLDGDGKSEIIFGATVLNSDGSLLWKRDRGVNEGSNEGYNGGLSVVADLDLDGIPEVVSGQHAYKADGMDHWPRVGTPDITKDGYPAVANFDADPQPEVVIVSTGTVRYVDGISGEIEWGPFAIPADPVDGFVGRGGPPTVADFDGDGLPEIGVAGGASYFVLNPDDAMNPILWQKPTIDRSSNATGSSVFDFQGDGVAEVIYADECFMRVYDGRTGDTLLEIPNSSATIHEYPLVVDVDLDGNSEIVITANILAGITARCERLFPGWTGSRQGIFVYGDVRDQWMRTRPVWNQHTYHVTNVSAAGAIPKKEDNNWETLNNYRQNTQGEGVFNAPDLSISGFDVDLSQCPLKAQLRARVANKGNLGVAAGVPVTFYSGKVGDANAVALMTVNTSAGILPGATTQVVAEVDLSGTPPFHFHAIVDDDGSQAESLVECDETNNGAGIDDVACSLLQ